MKLEPQHGQVDWGQQGVIMPGRHGPRTQVLRERERKKDGKRELERN